MKQEILQLKEEVKSLTHTLVEHKQILVEHEEDLRSIRYTRLRDVVQEAKRGLPLCVKKSAFLEGKDSGWKTFCGRIRTSPALLRMA